MAVSVVSPLLKRLTFVNWDKNSNIFHIDNITVYRRVLLVRMRLDERRLDQVLVYFAKGEPRNVEYGKVFLWKCNIWVLRTRKLPDAKFFIHSIFRN